MNQNLLVSVCIPTYNRANFLDKAIQSCLDQDYPNLEILVSDNCSTDNTNEILACYLTNPKISISTNKVNIGMVGNWHRMLYQMIKGAWFLILSDDDYLIDKSYISKAVRLIESCPEINLVYSSGYILYDNSNRYVTIDIPYEEIEDGVNIFLHKKIVKPQAFTLCNVIFRTEIAKRFDAFTDNNDLSCDSELFYKICVSGKVGVIHDYVSVYRIHASNLINEHKSYDQIISYLNKYIKPYNLLINRVGGGYDIDRWKNTVLKHALREIILYIAIYYPDELKETIRYIERLSIISTYKIFMDPLFFVKICITRNRILYAFANKIKGALRKIWV